ncbi:hypothetical protein JHK86_012226 [Glycine max]|nr:hypothetical protein JHK86_012226 [Glycine max]
MVAILSTTIATAVRRKVPLRGVLVLIQGEWRRICSSSSLSRNVVRSYILSHLVLVDTNADKFCDEMLDLQHVAAFLPRTKINASADSFVTVGTRQIAGESRLNLLQRNLSLFGAIIPPLIRYSPNTILLIISNPIDILTYAHARNGGKRTQVCKFGEKVDEGEGLGGVAMGGEAALDGVDDGGGGGVRGDKGGETDGEDAEGVAEFGRVRV